jgi:hypothetical protein
MRETNITAELPFPSGFRYVLKVSREAGAYGHGECNFPRPKVKVP